MKRKLLFRMLAFAVAIVFSQTIDAQSLAKGYYFIKSAYDYSQNNACIYDPGSSDYVKIRSCQSTKDDIFYLDEFETGKYSLKNAATGRYIYKYEGTNKILFSSSLSEDTWLIFDKAGDIWRWKDNTITTYYNWNGTALNAGAPLDATYNYHDWSAEPVPASILESLGLDSGDVPVNPDDTTKVDPVNPDDTTKVDSTKTDTTVVIEGGVKNGFYYIKSAYNSAYVAANTVCYDTQDEDNLRLRVNQFQKNDIFLIKQFEKAKYTVQNLGTARYINKFEGGNNVTMKEKPDDGVWIEFVNVKDDIYRFKDNKLSTFYNWNGSAINGGAGLSSTYNYHDFQLVPVPEDLLADFGVTGDSVGPIVTPKDTVAYIDASWCSLGTSITWYNNNVSSAFTKGYQTRVREEIPFKRFTNKGANASCLAGTENLVVFANYYTIEHGINDWGHSTPVGTLDDYINNTNNGTFAASYRKVIDKIYATNPKAMIVLCTPRKGYGFGGYLPDNCEAEKNGIYLGDYAKIIREIADYESIPVADFYSLCGNQHNLDKLSIDKALHPNDRGYQLMADVLIAAFRNVLIHEIITPVEDF